MKEQETYSLKPALPVALFGALLMLSACGGGSGGSPSAPSAPALSETQFTYESFALASNGGLFDLEGDVTSYPSATGTVTVAPASTFFTEQISIPKSPSGGAQLLTDTVATVASTLPAPTTFSGGRFMVGGTVYAAAPPSAGQVTYSGNNVQTDFYATDSNKIAYSVLSTNYTISLVSGLFASSPSELFNNSELGLINGSGGRTLYKQGSTWQAQSAYMKVTRQFLGDTLTVYDCTGAVTTGTNPTPCSSTVTTLENFFPAVDPLNSNVTYQIGDGQIVNSQNGVRAWVGNTPVASLATTVYPVFYEAPGGIYAGLLAKDGTVQQQFANDGTTQNFRIVFNAAAINSIKNAITF